MTAPSPAVPSSREAPPGELLVCHSCLLLKGPVPGRTDGARQFCDCTPGEVRRAQSRWGGDFNTYAELCRCCGLVLLRSGSRFSIWFCTQCLEAIKALNRSAGRSLVPIGRHSFMNGVGSERGAAPHRERCPGLGRAVRVSLRQRAQPRRLGAHDRAAQPDRTGLRYRTGRTVGRLPGRGQWLGAVPAGRIRGSALRRRRPEPGLA